MSAAVRTRNKKMLKAVSGELKRIDVIGRSFVDVVRPLLDFQSVAPIQLPTLHNTIRMNTKSRCSRLIRMLLALVLTLTSFISRCFPSLLPELFVQGNEIADQAWDTKGYQVFRAN